jgi:hypothetical protein
LFLNYKTGTPVSNYTSQKHSYEVSLQSDQNVFFLPFMVIMTIFTCYSKHNNNNNNNNNNSIIIIKIKIIINGVKTISLQTLLEKQMATIAMISMKVEKILFLSDCNETSQE